MLFRAPVPAEFILKQHGSYAVLLAIGQVSVIGCPELSALKDPDHSGGARVVVQAAGRFFSHEPVKCSHVVENDRYPRVPSGAAAETSHRDRNEHRELPSSQLLSPWYLDFDQLAPFASMRLNTATPMSDFLARKSCAFKASIGLSPLREFLYGWSPDACA
ncbi:MAG TPA: hypothetical protein VHU89_01965 [Acidobacteriaceae bacterium]|nr:hypothetical protein [Acidobacteriaceae bacterium]